MLGHTFHAFSRKCQKPKIWLAHYVKSNQSIRRPWWLLRPAEHKVKKYTCPETTLDNCTPRPTPVQDIASVPCPVYPARVIKVTCTGTYHSVVIRGNAILVPYTFIAAIATHLKVEWPKIIYWPTILLPIRWVVGMLQNIISTAT